VAAQAGSYKNLVFEGGGPKDAAFAGAIQVLDELGHYAGIERVAGTSSGSITATLLACGAGSQGLYDAVKRTDFRKFIADKGGLIGDAYRMARHFGLHSGDEFNEILKQNIATFAGDGSLTFAQLEGMAKDEGRKFKDLSVVASNLSRQQSVVFNARRTPKMPIWQAVRASISIPLVFEPVIIDGEYHVDGGLAWVYPVDIYDRTVVDRDGNTTHVRNTETLGFHFIDSGPDELRAHPRIDSMRQYFLAMTGFLIESGNRLHIHAEDQLRTVSIDDLGVGGSDFGISEEMINHLIENGRKATLAFFGITAN
jgi:NTE family protein